MEKEKSCHISANMKEGILEIVLTGKIAREDVKELQDEVFAVIKKQNAKLVLTDVRGIKGRYSFLEAFMRVRSYPKDTPRVHSATVDNEENARFEEFHEITAQNAGLSFKWFTKMDEARAWLKIEQKKDDESPREGGKNKHGK